MLCDRYFGFPPTKCFNGGVSSPCLLQDRSVFEHFAYPVLKSGKSRPFLQHKSLFAFYFHIQPTVVTGRTNLQHNIYDLDR